MISIWLKDKRDKSAKNFHPWIFSGAIEKIEGNPGPGDLIRAVNSKGEFLAYGHFSPNSQIRIRLLEWDEKAIVNDEWWRKRINESIEARRTLGIEKYTSAYRLIYSEADMLPGLIVDRYGEVIVLQALTVGIDKIKHLLAEILNSLINPSGIYERSDLEVRELEGLQPVNMPITGVYPDSGLVKIKEGEHNFFVNIKQGQKTGFFLDQRINRKIVGMYAKNRKVLDCFCYTGGFSVYAVKGGAKSVTCVDSSADALSTASGNFGLNGITSLIEIVEGDVFQVLRKYRDTGRIFEMIILDPPKFAPTRAHKPQAARAYKDINLLAMKLLQPGGILATFSCSSVIDSGFFKEILAWSGKDAGREVQVLETLSQSSDHPIRLSFPESEYLKGFICRVL